MPDCLIRAEKMGKSTKRFWLNWSSAPTADARSDSEGMLSWSAALRRLAASAQQQGVPSRLLLAWPDRGEHRQTPAASPPTSPTCRAYFRGPDLILAPSKCEKDCRCAT
jgi:hypothetical protein